jgi:hypothetical protein
MTTPQPDPRTDGQDEDLEQELPPPSDEEIAVGIEHDQHDETG